MNKVDYFRRRFADEFHNRKFSKAVETGKKLLFEQAHISSVGTDNYVRDMFNLALAYENIGDIESAVEVLRGSAWYSSQLDHEGLLFAKCLTGLATLISELGHKDSAYFMLAKACEIHLNKLGGSDPTLADSLYNLANAAIDIDMPMSALHYHLRALKIREMAENKEDIINSLHSIAFIFESTESYDEACSFAKNAVEHAQEVDDDLTYATCCTYLGELYTKSGRYDDALDMYCIATDEIEYVTGKEHSAYLNSAFLKATILAKLSLYDEAVYNFREILDIFENYLGTRHLFYANCLRNLAIAYENSGDMFMGKITMMDAVRIKRQLRSCAVLDVMFSLRLSLRLGILDEALKILVYAFMCLQSSSWSYEEGRDLILSIISSECKNEKAAFYDALERLESSGELEDIIGYWLNWEAV